MCEKNSNKIRKMSVIFLILNRQKRRTINKVKKKKRDNMRYCLILIIHLEQEFLILFYTFL